MKLTESVLRQMVKEELEAVLAEAEEGEKEDYAAKLRGSIKKSQEERGVYGRADQGREYLKRLMKSASKKKEGSS
jgi:hypothetical protein